MDVLPNFENNQFQSADQSGLGILDRISPIPEKDVPKDVVLDVFAETAKIGVDQAIEIASLEAAGTSLAPTPPRFIRRNA